MGLLARGVWGITVAAGKATEMLGWGGEPRLIQQPRQSVFHPE